jgi:hypothetical protein
MKDRAKDLLKENLSKSDEVLEQNVNDIKFTKTLSRETAINIFRNTKSKFEPYWSDLKNKWQE